MAYSTGSATDIEDLISDLSTFITGLSTTPWTQDELNTTGNYATFHRGTCYVSFRWDTSPETDLGIYQSLGFSGPSVTPENHTDDSGNGDTTVPISSGRRVNFESSGPFTAYHFFVSEGSTPVVYVVVEVSPGLFRHFWFGTIVKKNDFTGGEFVCGHVWSQSSTYIDNPTSSFHNLGCDDGITANQGGTIHVEDLSNQDAASKWGVFTTAASIGNDTAGESRVRVRGGTRGNFWGFALGWIPTSQLNAYKPLIPIDIVYIDEGAATDAWRWLGYLPDLAVVNMKNLTAAQEITVGSDTWMVFPWVRKQYLTNNTEESWNAGFAYKKTT